MSLHSKSSFWLVRPILPGIHAFLPSGSGAILLQGSDDVAQESGHVRPENKKKHVHIPSNLSQTLSYVLIS